MGSIKIEGVEDVSMIDLNLRHIFKKLEVINFYVTLGGVSPLMKSEAIRANLIDIQKAAETVMKEKGLAEELIDKYSLKRLVALEYLVSTPYGHAETERVVTQFRYSMLQDLHSVYSETFAD